MTTLAQQARDLVIGVDVGGTKIAAGVVDAQGNILSSTRLPTAISSTESAGALLAYEKTGYDATKQGRLPDLLPQWSVRRLLEAGTNAVKILFYYNPFDDPQSNEIKQAFIERVGAECTALDTPFSLEPLAYDDLYADRGYEFAQRKPRYVQATMEEFSKERYQVDITKLTNCIGMLL